MTVPQTRLAPLQRADGSATYSFGEWAIVSAVNGPIEVLRRDEIPDEAALEVNVRPAVGIGGPRERHLELLLHSTLRHILLTHLHPRSLIQLTLQILASPQISSASSLPFLTPLINAATPALLHASIPISTICTASTVALVGSKPILDPNTDILSKASSVHVFAFSGGGEMLLAESEGAFTVDEWDVAVQTAQAARSALEENLRAAVGAKMMSDEAWRES